MTLRGRRIDNCLESWCLVYSGGVDILVLSASFQKNNIPWPQQPPTARVSDISKKWIFDDPFHKKRPVLIILVLGIIQL